MNEWISVKEKLPPEGVAVLAYWKFTQTDLWKESNYEVVWLQGGTWWQADDSDQDYRAPDFWMPLPKAPDAE
jgi:hypothetical protein